MGTEEPSSVALLENKLNEKIQDIYEELNIRIRKSDGLLSYLKQTIENYSLKRKFARVVIQGSVGNNLYFPEILEDGTYRVEIDMLFEQDSNNVTLPGFVGENRYPQVMVEVVADEGVSSQQYVKLKVTRLPEGLRDEDQTVFFEFDDVSGEYYLKNSEYLNDLPSIKDEIKGGIFGEKEITTGGVFASFQGRKPFRAFKTERKQLIIDEETIDYQLLMDKVAAIKVKWPEVSTVWETRERLWPPFEVCKEITCGGIHVIPKSSHKSTSTTQWKYTFAIAEQRLAHLFTPIQRACYLILKQLKRKYFSQVSLSEGQVIIPSGISTHHLKTVMFWTSERTEPINLFERLWMDESKFLFVKDDNQLRDARIQGVLELVLQVQVHLEDYLTSELLQTVDEDHERTESNAKFAEKDFFSGFKFEMAKQLASLDSLFTDFHDFRESKQEEKAKKDEL
ncbi:Protein MB21D2 [Stylophora pistillata]|uniref:Protein MB21D2 n=1 Tax=Stylophora pistillata TaxID=50429 RepID=A0A2B4SMB8_STYPI|nr:Protein MB21D2 [Stylophora pistillata]